MRAAAGAVSGCRGWPGPEEVADGGQDIGEGGGGLGMPGGLAGAEGTRPAQMVGDQEEPAEETKQDRGGTGDGGRFPVGVGAEQGCPRGAWPRGRWPGLCATEAGLCVRVRGPGRERPVAHRARALIGVVKIRSRVNVRPFDPVREGPPTAAPKADPVREGPRWIRAQP